MAKKSRRAKAKHRARVARATQATQATQEIQEGRSQQLKPMPTKLQSPTRVSPKAQDFTSRYQYVLPEIKRIGIIAGAIILVLIILSFVLG
jgi:hypothetical protein